MGSPTPDRANVVYELTIWPSPCVKLKFIANTVHKAENHETQNNSRILVYDMELPFNEKKCLMKNEKYLKGSWNVDNS